MTNAESMTKAGWGVARFQHAAIGISALDLFSANGAYQPSLGQRPAGKLNLPRGRSAESAFHPALVPRSG